MPDSQEVKQSHIQAIQHTEEKFSSFSQNVENEEDKSFQCIQSYT